MTGAVGPETGGPVVDGPWLVWRSRLPVLDGVADDVAVRFVHQMASVWAGGDDPVGDAVLAAQLDDAIALVHAEFGHTGFIELLGCAGPGPAEDVSAVLNASWFLVSRQDQIVATTGFSRSDVAGAEDAVSELLLGGDVDAARVKAVEVVRTVWLSVHESSERSRRSRRHRRVAEPLMSAAAGVLLRLTVNDPGFEGPWVKASLS